MRDLGIRVAGGRTGTVGPIGWCGDTAARSGLSGGAATRRHDQRYHWGERWERRGRRESQRRVYCQEVAWRGKEHPSTLPLLSAACVRAHSSRQSQSGASPQTRSIYIASGTPHNPSVPGLDRVMGHDYRGRDISCFSVPL